MQRALFVPYDGSRRSQRALDHAIDVCQLTRAHLGVAVIRRYIVACGWPGVSAASFVSERDSCRDLLRRVPDDVSVQFLTWSWPVGLRDIAAFARRLQCDAVVLPGGRLRDRRAARVLSRWGFEVIGAKGYTMTPDIVSSARPRPHEPYVLSTD